MIKAQSERYFDGLVIHSVKPLANWSTAASHTTGNSRLRDVSGMDPKNPRSRSPMINTKPMTIAVPYAWMVSANGQPHNDSPRAHSENAEFSRYSITLSLLPQSRRSHSRPSADIPF